MPRKRSPKPPRPVPEERLVASHKIGTKKLHELESENGIKIILPRKGKKKAYPIELASVKIYKEHGVPEIVADHLKGKAGQKTALLRLDLHSGQMLELKENIYNDFVRNRMASRLIKALEKKAKAQGIDFAWGNANADNQIITGAYEAAGFKKLHFKGLDVIYYFKKL